MGTYITQAQLDDVKELVQSGASPKQVWDRLAQYGDTYADGAGKVFQSDSHGWYTVRAIWDVTGADMPKFDTVDRTHSRVNE